MSKQNGRQGSGLRRQIKQRAARTGESHAAALEALRKRKAKRAGEVDDIDPAQVEAGMKALAILMAPENVDRMKMLVADAIRTAPVVIDRIKRNVAVLTSPESLEQLRVGVGRVAQALPVALGQLARTMGMLLGSRVPPAAP